MDFINKTSGYVTRTLDDNSHWLNNSAITTLLSLVFVIYAAFFADRMNNSTRSFFGHPIVKILSFALVIYFASRNIALGVAALIALFSIYFANMSSNAEHYSAINMDDTQYLVNSNDNFPTAMDSLNGTVGQKINRESGSAYKRYVNDESTGTYGRDVKGGTAITYGGGCVNDNSARTYEGGCVNENSARTYEGEDENGESDNVDAGSGDIDDNEQAKPIEPVESSNESSYAPADFQ